MYDEAGRKRIAETVRAAMAWKGMTAAHIEASRRISRASIDRVKRSDPKVSDTVLRGLGDALGLPRDFLLYVGAGDIKRIEATSGDADLVRWAVDLINADGAKPARGTTRKAAGQ